MGGVLLVGSDGGRLAAAEVGGGLVGGHSELLVVCCHVHGRVASATEFVSALLVALKGSLGHANRLGQLVLAQERSLLLPGEEGHDFRKLVSLPRGAVLQASIFHMQKGLRGAHLILVSRRVDHLRLWQVLSLAMKVLALVGRVLRRAYHGRLWMALLPWSVLAALRVDEVWTDDQVDVLLHVDGLNDLGLKMLRLLLRMLTRPCVTHRIQHGKNRLAIRS